MLPKYQGQSDALIRQQYAVVLAGIMFLGLCAQSRGQDTEDFEARVFAEGLDQPIALAIGPDGRTFVAQRGGLIRVIANGAVDEEPWAQLDVFEFAECGLSGIVLDPDFSDNGYLYAMACVSDHEQQIIRLTDTDGRGLQPVVLKGNLPTQGGIHNGGCVRIGGDGKLYFSIGDLDIPQNAQQVQTLSGKISRINLDGSIPADNPFVTPTGTKRAVFALGFRNPFRFCFSQDGRLITGDVGSMNEPRREEINIVEAAGNYGWPDAEGFQDANAAPGYTDPILAYSEEGAAISGIVSYHGGQFPEEFTGDLFHLDFVSQALFRVRLDGGHVVGHTKILGVSGGPVDLAVSNQGTLFYTELFTGRVMEVLHKQGEQLPAPSSDGSVIPTADVARAPGSPCGLDAGVAVLINLWLLQARLSNHRRGSRRAIGMASR